MSRAVSRPRARVIASAVLLLSLALAAGTTSSLAAWSSDPAVNTRVPLGFEDPVEGMTVEGVVPDSAGGALVFTHGYCGGPENGDHWVQRVDQLGRRRWGAEGVWLTSVATGATTRSRPVADGAGGAFVAWETPELVALTHVHADGSTTDLLLSTLSIIPQTHEPVVASDGAGGAIVAWWDIRTPAGYWAQRVSATDQSRWTNGGVPLQSEAWSGNPYGWRCIVGDGAGGALLFATCPSWTNSWDIRVFSVDSLGQRRTAGTGSVVCDAPAEQGWWSLPSNASRWAVPDGAGGAIAVWLDRRADTGGDLYAQRVAADGTRQWPTYGTPLCAVAGEPRDVDAVPDGAGGMVVAWTEYGQTPGYAPDVFAQRVDGTGAVRWGARGLAACIAVGTQQRPALAERASGGAIVAWDDARDARLDVYAQSIALDGTRQWGPAGTPMCVATGDQSIPFAAPVAGRDWAIVAWRDSRAADGLVCIGDFAQAYAQLVPLDIGPLLDVPPTPLAPLVRLRVAPNPAFASARVALMRDVSAHATLELLDVAGRVVRTRDLSALAPGAREVTLDDLGALPPGLYLVRVKQGERVDHARLLVTH